MSALAEIMISRGFTVTGSDSHESKITDHLESLGAKIFYNQVAGNISSNIDVLIYTAAIKQDNPELVKAKELGIPLLTRAEFLGQIMLNYPMAIGVSGTHGKTTTTSMLSQIMLEGNTCLLYTSWWFSFTISVLLNHIKLSCQNIKIAASCIFYFNIVLYHMVNFYFFNSLINSQTVIFVYNVISNI